MRRLTCLLTLILALTFGVAGSNATPYTTFETITVANTAIGFTAATIDPPGYTQMKTCRGRLETAEIRFRTDGVAPTSSVGTPLEPLEILTLPTHEDMQNLLMIRTGSTSGVITFECKGPQ